MAIMFSAFTVLSESTASLAWHIINQLLTIASFFLILRLLPGKLTPLRQAVACFSFFSFFPLANNSIFGNYDSLILLLVALALYVYQRGNEYHCGALLALGTMLKVFPGFLIFYFIIKRRWRVLLASFITGAVLFAATLIYIPFNRQMEYLYMITHLKVVDASPLNQSLVGFFTRLLTYDEIFTAGLANLPWLADIFIILGRLLFIGLFCLLCLRSSGNADAIKMEYGLGIVTLLIVANFTDNHHISLAIIPFILLFDRYLLGHADNSSIYWALGAYAVLCSFIPLSFIRVVNFGKFQQLLVGWKVVFLSIDLYALIVLWVITFQWLQREGMTNRTGSKR